MKHTLNDQAAAQEGAPIPADKRVRVELIDSDGNTVEYGDYAGANDAAELKAWLADYAVSMIAEGQRGEVRWRPIGLLASDAPVRS